MFENDKIITKEMMINPFSMLKPYEKNIWRQKEYINIILNTLMSMFDYDTELKIDKNIIEYLLLCGGSVAFDGVNFGFAIGNGELLNDGYFEKYNVLYLDGKSKIFKRDEIAVGFNNPTRTRETTIYRFAEQFAQVDLSEVNNIQYTRIYPLVVTKSKKVAEMVRQFFSSMKIGSPIKIADESIFKNDSSVEVKSITDIDAINKLQYLSTYHNDLLRRFYSLYGQALSEGMKQAQQSVAEVSSNVSSSFIIPLSMLRERKSFCKEIKEKFNIDIDVHFSPSWEVEYNKFKLETTVESTYDNEKESEENVND